MNWIFFIPTVVLAFIGNFYWFKIIAILETNGYKAYLFWNQWETAANFIKLIRQTENKKLKSQYKVDLYVLFGSFLLFICGIFTSTLSI